MSALPAGSHTITFPRVQTLAGQQDVSMQLLDRGGEFIPPTYDFGWVWRTPVEQTIMDELQGFTPKRRQCRKRTPSYRERQRRARQARHYRVVVGPRRHLQEAA